MTKVVFSRPNEIKVINGLKYSAFDPSYLKPGDYGYHEEKREKMRGLFKRLRPNLIANVLPPILTGIDPEDGDIVVFDGNHRAEAANFTVKPIVGILLDTQESIDQIRCLSEKNKALSDATVLLRHLNISRISGLENHIFSIRQRLKRYGILSFDDYREKAETDKDLNLMT